MILEEKTRDFCVKWGISEEKMRDFQVISVILKEKTGDFFLNGKFQNISRMIFKLNG